MRKCGDFCSRFEAKKSGFSRFEAKKSGFFRLVRMHAKNSQTAKKMRAI
jgi:hypothetical protein